jgi:hypothetical protein
MDDERIAKQALNGNVEGVIGKGRTKNSWLGVVDKCTSEE